MWMGSLLRREWRPPQTIASNNALTFLLSKWIRAPQSFLFALKFEMHSHQTPLLATFYFYVTSYTKILTCSFVPRLYYLLCTSNLFQHSFPFSSLSSLPVTPVRLIPPADADKEDLPFPLLLLSTHLSFNLNLTNICITSSARAFHTFNSSCLP